jgi:hypothetical protein
MSKDKNGGGRFAKERDAWQKRIKKMKAAASHAATVGGLLDISFNSNIGSSSSSSSSSVLQATVSSAAASQVAAVAAELPIQTQAVGDGMDVIFDNNISSSISTTPVNIGSTAVDVIHGRISDIEVVTGFNIGSSSSSSGVSRDTRNRSGRVQDRSGQNQDRTGREQDRTGREQDRTGREQAQRDRSDRVRNPRSNEQRFNRQQRDLTNPPVDNRTNRVRQPKFLKVDQEWDYEELCQ